MTAKINVRICQKLAEQNFKRNFTNTGYEVLDYCRNLFINRVPEILRTKSAFYNWLTRWFELDFISFSNFILIFLTVKRERSFVRCQSSCSPVLLVDLFYYGTDYVSATLRSLSIELYKVIIILLKPPCNKID